MDHDLLAVVLPRVDLRLFFINQRWHIYKPSEGCYQASTVPQAIEIIRPVMGELISKAREYSRLCREAMARYPGVFVKDISDKYMKRTSSVVTKLGSGGEETKIVKMLETSLLKDATLFDSSATLLHFRDSVVDLHQLALLPPPSGGLSDAESAESFLKRILLTPVVRKPESSDLNLNTTEYSLDPLRFYHVDCMLPDVTSAQQAYSRLNEDYDRIVQLMKQIMPNAAEHACLRVALSAMLDGHNRKHFVCFADDNQGNNGKSTLLTFLAKALGKYCRQLPKNYLLVKAGAASRASGEAATPFLASCQGARMVYEDETSGTVMAFDTAQLKNLTNGQDAFVTGRKLYGDPFTFPWCAKLLWAFNRIAPQMDLSDSAGISRMRAFNFQVHFVPPGSSASAGAAAGWGPGAGYNITAMADNSIKERIPQLRLAFMVWLLRGYPLFINDCEAAVPETEGMRDFKMRLLCKGSPAWRWVQNNVVPRNTNAFIDGISVNTLYEAFSAAAANNGGTAAANPITYDAFVIILRMLVDHRPPPSWVPRREALVNKPGGMFLRGYMLRSSGGSGGSGHGGSSAAGAGGSASFLARAGI